MSIMIMSSMLNASTQIKQFEKCVRKRRTRIRIKIQKVKNRLDETLIYEFFEISFMNLSRRLRVS